MRLLVLGGGGRLGRLLQACWPKDAPEAHWHAGSSPGFDILKDHAALTATIAKATAVLVLAGVTQNRPDRPFQTNVDIAQTVLRAAGGTKTLLASTAAVYGRLPGLLTEDMADPISAYGQSKHQMERVAANVPNATCLRIGNVAGADALLGETKADQTLHQFDDGTFPTRSYIGPVSLARTIAQLALLQDLPPILNVAAPDPVSMASLLDTAGWSYRTVPAPTNAIKAVHMDTRKLQPLVTPIPGDAGSIIAELQDAQARL